MRPATTTSAGKPEGHSTRLLERFCRDPVLRDVVLENPEQWLVELPTEARASIRRAIDKHASTRTILQRMMSYPLSTAVEAFLVSRR